MEISTTKIEQILKTLPIGYYIKRNVPVTLSETGSSYYNPIEDKITISAEMIKCALKDITNTTDVESDVRTILYHELSHAFITPKELQMTNVINIFEDERIETLLADYYKDVHFKEFCKRLNNFHGEEPKSADELYYNVVRFRTGPEHFVKRVALIIAKYEDIFDRYKRSYYITDVEKLYSDICRYFDTSEETKRDIDDYENKKVDDEIQKTNVKLGKNADEDITKILTPATTLVNKRVTTYIDTTVINDFDMILRSYKNITKQNGSAINAYSGVFNPRSVIRDDYKYFVQQNRIGHVKAYSKLHFNLFIDCSSSFYESDTTVNKILYALSKFEKSNPNFDFTMISCGMGQRIRDKDDRIQFSKGGNYLSKQIFEQFKQVQDKNAQNINIVLFDGYANTDVYKFSDTRANADKNFSAFNTSNTIIISNDANMDALNRYCKLAKTIITTDYANELYSTILQNLSQLCK